MNLFFFLLNCPINPKLLTWRVCLPLFWFSCWFYYLKALNNWLIKHKIIIIIIKHPIYQLFAYGISFGYKKKDSWPENNQKKKKKNQGTISPINGNLTLILSNPFILSAISRCANPFPCAVYLQSSERRIFSLSAILLLFCGILKKKHTWTKPINLLIHTSRLHSIIALCM